MALKLNTWLSSHAIKISPNGKHRDRFNLTRINPMAIKNLAAEVIALINMGRADYKATEDAALKRETFLQGLMSQGFTSANTAGAKKGSNIDPKWRKQALVICAGAIKINGKRLSDADLVRVADEEVSNKVILAGTPKGAMSETVTWLGNAASHLNKIRKDLAAMEDAKVAGVAGTPKMTKAKKEVFMDYVQKAYNLTFKEDAPTKDAVTAQKLCRDLAKTVGGTLSTPTKK
jgi:hypothetical protein